MRDNLALLLLRLGVGGMMFFGHGLGKMLNFSSRAAMFPDPLHIGNKLSMALAIFGEFICPFLVMLGVRTRWAAVPPLITMLVAGFIVHAGDPWQNKELALLYAVCFLAIFLMGGGRYTLEDEYARRRR